MQFATPSVAKCTQILRGNLCDGSEGDQRGKLVGVKRSWVALVCVSIIGLVLVAWFGLALGGDSPEIALENDEYLDAVHGSWLATMVANHSGIPIEGIYLDEPGPGDSIELVLLDQWSTDDDTHIEWLDLHIMETHGLEPTFEQIRDEWVDHLDGDIWVSTLRARELMNEGILPPETGDAALNPEGAWSIDAQLETELFGLISPGDPDEARRRARRFASITNRGPAVDASAFYAHMYSQAFFESDVTALVIEARAGEPADSIVAPIVDDVVGWYEANPDDWRPTRELIRDRYDTDPEWWASRVNFASTIMALLYGQGDLQETVTIAGLAGWDADNNMTSAAGLIGITIGFENLPEPYRSATDVYFNEDLVGDLPQFDSVRNIAERTVALGSS